MSSAGRASACVGRVLLSLIFVASGVQKIMAWDQTAAQMDSEGLPAVPVLLVGAILLELGGGLSLLLGIKARLGAIALILFLIPVTLIMHDFWTYEGQEQQAQMAHFMKNLAIMGGLFVVAGFGPGCCSVTDRPRPEHAATTAG